MEIQKELTISFPGLRVAELKLENLMIKKQDSALEEFKSEVQQRTRKSVSSLNEVKDRHAFRAYRDFFWRVGIDPTKTRPAGRLLSGESCQGGEIPTINTFVDSYNLASAETHVAVAAFDLSSVNESELLMRRAAPGETFLGIGMPSPIELKGAELVIEDTDSQKLIAVYPYRDFDDSKITEESRNVLLMMCGVPGLELPVLGRARVVTKSYVERFCR